MRIKRYVLLMMIVYTTTDCAALVEASSAKKENDTSSSTSTPIAPEASHPDLSHVPAAILLANSSQRVIMPHVPNLLQPTYRAEYSYGPCTLVTQGVTTYRGCCNESCEPTPACCPSWTAFCLGVAVYCPLSFACRSLLLFGSPCCLVYECYYNAHHPEAVDEERKLLRAYDFSCMQPCKFFAGVPLPKNKRAQEFIIQACRLPICMPCAAFYCYEDRARCVCCGEEG